MALPAGVTRLGAFQGVKGEKGDTGTLSAVSATSVPADQPARVTMTGPESAKAAHFEIPRGLPGVNAVEGDEATAAWLAAEDSKLRAASYIATPRALGDVSLREWVSAGDLPNDEDGNASPLFAQAITDLAAAFESSGQISTLLVPAGRYGNEQRLTPPMGSSGLRGYFGVKGEGMYRTVFLTAPNFSWLGINQQGVNDPDWAAEKMVFEDFTVDGILQPVGSSYVAGLKAFILHNVRETVFRRVRGCNTHATIFGVDYSQADFFDCIAEYGGRARHVHDPDPSTRFGSGSGFGIGFGQKVEELIRLFRVISRFNGASGIFAEQLGQPEAMHKAIGMMVSGATVQGNAIGINDTGTRGSQYSQVFALDNEYAGVRVGISNASEQGGIDGRFAGLTAARNRFGVVLEGSAEGSYLFDGLEVFDNTEDGVAFRDTQNAWPAPNVRFRGTHIHHNGGHGLAAYTPNPIVGLDFDGLVHDNGGAGFHLLSPLSRPVIEGRVFGNEGFAIELPGAAQLESPVINLDVHGSAGGGLSNQHATTDALINVHGNPVTVTQHVTQPRPTSSTVLGTDWIGQSATITYATSALDEDGQNLGRHIAGTATGASPRLIGTPVTVTGGQIVTVSVLVLAPKGKSIQPAARFGSGGSAVWVPGPLVRSTGKLQRLHVTIAVPAGQTVARSGVIGASGVDTWTAGDVLRATCANLTFGGQMWPYIDGDQPNCAWSGTAGSSTSTLTIPAVTGGFAYDFTSMPDGPLDAGWVSAVNTGTTIPAVISGGALTYGTGGTASRTIHMHEGGSANGTLRAVVDDVGEFWMSLLLRATDAGNFIAVDFRRNTDTATVRLSKRVGTTLTEVAYTPSATLANGDVIEVVSVGTSITVKVNGSVLFGGAQTITEHAAITRHGFMLVSNAVARTEALSQLRFTPVA